MAKILGIDPALTYLGWGVIELKMPKINYMASGVIKTDSKTQIHLRLSHIIRSMGDVINQYQPDAIAMEETFINLNAASSLKLAYVRGALMSCFGATGLPYYEFLPNKIKKTITGVGHAEKEQVQHMIKIVISNTPENLSFDEADALAAAYTCSVYKNTY